MGAIEFTVKDIGIIDKKYIYIKENEDFSWCNYKYLNRAEFSLLEGKIVVYTRDYSDTIDEYFLKQKETKFFYIVPKDYDKSRHFSFSSEQVTRENFISEYKKRKEKQYD